MADTGVWGLVTIHFRDPAAVARLVEATQGWLERPRTTVVVDNSGDLGAMPDGVVVVRPDRNLGYAAAVNLGVQRLRETLPDLAHVLVCTQDAVLEPEATAAMLATAVSDPRIGAVGPLLTFVSSPATLFSAGGTLTRDGVGLHPGQRGPVPPGLHGPVDVDWMDGAVLLLSAEALLAVGGLDEDYFLYYEEIDLQVRLRAAGYRIVLDRDARGGQEPGNYRTYFKYRNGVHFTRVFAGAYRPWPWVRLFGRDLVRAAIGRARFQPGWALRGVRDGRRGRMGPPPRGVLAHDGGRPAAVSASAVVLTEFPAAELPTGVRRRAEHLVQHLERQGVAVQSVVLNTASRRSIGVRERRRRARAAGTALAGVPRARPVVVVGLGTPTMLDAARALDREGRPVVFDHCDGLALQLRERLRLRDARLLAIVAWLLASHLASSRRIAFSYISARDAAADRVLDRRHAVALAPPVEPEALAALPPTSGPVRRVVVPVELASKHARAGFDLLLAALSGRTAPLPVELWGPTAPDVPLPDGVVHRGYAPELADLYRGETAVLVTNIGGSGVPNKLVEAVAARRPLVLHPSMLQRWPVRSPVLAFTTADELRLALDALAAGSTGTVPPQQAQPEHAFPDLGALIRRRSAARGLGR